MSLRLAFPRPHMRLGPPAARLLFLAIFLAGVSMIFVFPFPATAGSLIELETPVASSVSTARPLLSDHSIHADGSVTLRICFDWSCASRQYFTFTSTDMVEGGAADRHRFSQLVHWTAVVVDSRDAHAWSVDSWLRHNGHCPVRYQAPESLLLSIQAVRQEHTRATILPIPHAVCDSVRNIPRNGGYWGRGKWWPAIAATKKI